MFTSTITTLLSFLLIPSLLGVANAANDPNALTGYAWSPNVGWLSMNCTNESCASTNYDVEVGSGGTRVLSGYAWSSNIGWITFDAAKLSGCPSGTCNAQMNSANGLISGWARACSVFVSNCTGALKPDDELGGWRGWIKLRGSTYGLLANGTAWTGYAWGGGPVTGTGNWNNPPTGTVGGNAVIGWISFRGYTTTGELYGVDAPDGSTAEGPRTVSCGADRTAAEVGEQVTWTAVVDSAKLTGPYTYTWGGNDGPTGSCTTGCTNTHSVNRTYSAASPNPKTAWVRVTANGVPYVVNCDAAAVPGSPGTWYDDVTIGDFDLEGLPGVTPSGSLEEGTQVTLEGDIRNNEDDIVDTTFPNGFEIDTDGNLGTTGDRIFVDGTTLTDLAPGVTTQVTAYWTPSTAGTYYIRVCADRSNGNPSGLINEGASDETNNCPGGAGAWTTVTIDPPAVVNLDQNGATCKPSPSVTPANRPVTWKMEGSVTGGTGTYTYTWDLPGGTPSSGSGSSLQTTYSTSGTKTASVTVHSAGVPDLMITCSVNARVQTFEEF